ncbi:hypothetical protein FD723_41155 (plasmid) [Nostoc sp. C052]|uniref:hypothetical protein n=1 Tax=Nostoc sp. C052 TaxID=2576902 RepID=UPI0015C37193|nr:hypothetical protein [Nostoc sp. C052]QLE46618.1 hypothetical protein FD723_41155 [Nostoc sp. C052]
MESESIAVAFAQRRREVRASAGVSVADITFNQRFAGNLSFQKRCQKERCDRLRRKIGIEIGQEVIARDKLIVTISRLTAVVRASALIYAT